MKTPFITIKDLIMDFPASTENPDQTSAEMVRVLDHINLELSEGEIVGVIGRSGCGKTVLIHLIRGIDQAPTAGKIIYHISLPISSLFTEPGIDSNMYKESGNSTGFKLLLFSWDFTIFLKRKTEI